MPTNSKIKILLDLCMVGILFACMSYLLIGEKAHEWLGCSIFLLFILHHILNWGWYKNLFQKNFSWGRFLQTTINSFLFLSMLGLMSSGIILSRYVFASLPISGMASFARILHMLSAYWGFVLLSLHLGLHWSNLLKIMQKRFRGKALSKKLLWGIRAIAFIVAYYGLLAFIKQDFLSYMLLRNQFVFFDVEQPLFLFFLNEIAIMAFWIWLVYYIRQGFIKSRNRNYKKVRS